MEQLCLWANHKEQRQHLEEDWKRTKRECETQAGVELAKLFIALKILRDLIK